METVKQPERMTHKEWLAEAERRFGKDSLKWKFVCPSCGHVASTEDYKKAGARPENVGFSCVGRWTLESKKAFGKDGTPCNYAGGGLIRLNPITVLLDDGGESQVFAFADAEVVEQEASRK
jgi:hypothetical protein